MPTKLHPRNDADFVVVSDCFTFVQGLQPVFQINYGIVTILHVSTASSWRGGEQQLANLIEANKYNCKNIVLCAKGSAMEKHCINSGVLHHTFNKTWPALYRAAFVLKKLSRNSQISLIHCHDSHAHTMAVIAISFLGNKCPVVVHRRVDFPIGKSWFSKYKYNHPAILGYICVSDTIREILVKDLKQPEKAITIYSGIDFNRFKESGTPQNKLKTELGISAKSILIGNTAALAPHKDYATFVRTAAILSKKYPDFHFVILGDGPLREQIEKLIEMHQLQKKISLTGFRNDLPELLNDLDVFLMTSQTEGLGTSLLDAFYVGVPVVATRAGGIPEIIEHEFTGLLSEVADEKELAKQVERMIMDKNLRNFIIENARKKVIQFNFAHTAKKTLDFYNEKLQNNN